MARIGQLNERVTFQRLTRISDGGGGYSESWADYFSCAARVLPMSGDERATAAQTESPRDYRIMVRRCSEAAAVKTADRLLWRGAVMQIRFIADAGPTPLYLFFECQSGVN